MSDKVFVGRDLTGFENNGKMQPVTRVTLIIDEETRVTAGDDTGREISANCPYATQAMAEAILAKLKGYQYQMYTADAANIDPAAELGDGMTADGVYGVISRLSDDGGGYPDLEGPGEAELEDEYPVGDGPMTREFNQRMSATRAYITKTSTEIRADVKNEVEGLASSLSVQLESITTQVSGIDGRVSTVEQTASGLTSTVEGLGGAFSTLEQTVDGVTITDESGTTRIRGSSIETESIAAGAIRADQITLTGKITWGDLDTGVQGNINNRGISSATAKSIAHTTISEDLVESPTIKGAEIFGGAFYDLDGEAKLSLYAGAYGAAGLVLEGADGNSTAFHIYPSISDQQGVGTWFSGASLGLCGEDIFVVSKDSYSSSRLLVTFQSHSYSMLGSWNFSGATVTGLKIA